MMGLEKRFALSRSKKELENYEAERYKKQQNSRKLKDMRAMKTKRKKVGRREVTN